MNELCGKGSSVVYILRFTKYILMTINYKKLAYIRKYYSVIEIYHYIKINATRHRDASFEHSPRVR
jgi:hypothetical protein